MLSFEHLYSTLPEPLWVATQATPVSSPELIAFNAPLAHELGAKEIPDSETLAQWFSGNQLMPEAKPGALGYAGHQFGNFVPQLGDGRALLLGEVIDQNGVRRDVQLKGSGRTPFSRGGDGRSPLGPVLREYLVSEFMAAMGIPTTRALAAVTSGERVIRQMAEPGAVFTRVASSHIRVGTFQFAASRRDEALLKALADHVIERHYPVAANAEDPYLALLEAVVARQAVLIARWMSVGFIHGVMNTDNCSIAGETIDYGPCAFMEQFNPQKVFSSIDQGRRYAFDNQPAIAQWNLARFAETLLPLMREEGEALVEQATEIIRRFEPLFDAEQRRLHADKLGLTPESDQAVPLMEGLESQMHQGRMDMTATFDALTQYANSMSDKHREALLALTTQPNELTAWLDTWQVEQAANQDSERLAAMRHANPVIIPRNHRVQEVIDAAYDGDFVPFHTLLAVVTKPFDESVEARRLAAPATENEQVLRTFCGT
ncbi:protein adenylyltransferase SelO [Vreelandella neptunia]|uniref:Protein nucleotidyltransferase YdiU n=1 Tax=Vreelandella neptunia TaxID=115551 RepID=A0ABZ0YQJ5_9GAMM|nr:YdiU family protein [Halomonas neptunia]MDN3558534.1 YdiU family protein [Halomonas neptunia]WQH13505.1 YdiU family protein [Halomonas neptunia]